MLLVALLPLLAPQAPQVDTWIPARRIEIEGLAEARTVAAAGDQVAFVRVLPIPEAERRMHAPRPPWQLVRVGPDQKAAVLTESAGARTGWGQPSFLAVEADGTVAASWRPGHRALYAAPGAATVEFPIHDDPALECAALSTRWIVHLHTRTRELTARPLTPTGVGEPFRVAGDGPDRPDRLLCGPPWLAWLDGGRVVAVAVGGRERRSLSLPAADQLVIDGIWNGRLFAHDNAHAHVVELASGVAHSLPAPQNVAVRAALPEGVFTSGWRWDPVADSLRRMQVTPFWDVQRLLRRGPGVLWIQDRNRTWLELRLAEPAAVPGDAQRIQAPELPTAQLGAEDAVRAARAAWRTARDG